MQSNKRKAGFTIEERQSFEKNFLDKGFVDTFRRQHRGVLGYTFWGWDNGRETNKGILFLDLFRSIIITHTHGEGG